MEIAEGFVVCDKSKKEEILKELNQKKEIKNYIFLTLSELENKLYGFCAKDSIFTLMQEYRMSYALALEYMRYIPYVEDKAYHNPKLDSLVTAKRLLLQRGLYIQDAFFPLRLRQFPLTFVCLEENALLKKVRERVAQYTVVADYIPCMRTHKPVVHAFHDIYDEVVFVCNRITELVRKKVPYHKIHICNMDREYAFLFERLAGTYSLPLQLPKHKNINALPIAKRFLSLCGIKESFAEVLQDLDSESKYYRLIFNLIVTYNLENKRPSEYRTFFYEQFKQTPFSSTVYEDMISVENPRVFSDDEYVFYLGLNLGSAPRVYRDEQYLTDMELSILNLPTSAEKNIVEKEGLKRILLGTKNITVSFKRFKGSEEYLPSNCIFELGLEVIEEKNAYGYSKTEDRIRLGILYTLYQKYRISDSALEQYSLKDLDYQRYDNKYKKIDNSLMTERYRDKPLKMAYSNLKTFFACPFAYYADRILGLNEFKPSMSARLGSFSHAVLEDSYSPDFDFDKSVVKNTALLAEDGKDKFYFMVMQDILRDLIDFNRRQEGLSVLNTVEREAHIVYTEEEFLFEGFIDKLLYTEINGEIYAAIIDYKTGKDVISLDNASDGFHLQLPSYMFLLSKYDKFQGKPLHVIGIYLQKVNIIALDNTMDIVSQREKSFKLQGFSVQSRELLRMLDPNFDKSEYIAGMSTLKSGEFSRYARLITEDNQKELIELVENLIRRANREIRSAEFTIAPKYIDGKNESCTFCRYRDICYMKYEDLVELAVKPYPKEKEGE